jgi:hypothetical protein
MLYHDKVCAGNASPLHGFADGLIQAAHVWVTIVFEINGCRTYVGSRPALSFRDGLAVTFRAAPPGMNADSSFAVDWNPGDTMPVPPSLNKQPKLYLSVPQPMPGPWPVAT